MWASSIKAPVSSRQYHIIHIKRLEKFRRTSYRDLCWHLLSNLVSRIPLGQMLADQNQTIISWREIPFNLNGCTCSAALLVKNWSFSLQSDNEKPIPSIPAIRKIIFALQMLALWRSRGSWIPSKAAFPRFCQFNINHPSTKYLVMQDKNKINFWCKYISRNRKRYCHKNLMVHILQSKYGIIYTSVLNKCIRIRPLSGFILDNLNCPANKVRILEFWT